MTRPALRRPLALFLAPFLVLGACVHDLHNGEHTPAPTTGLTTGPGNPPPKQQEKTDHFANQLLAVDFAGIHQQVEGQAIGMGVDMREPLTCLRKLIAILNDFDPEEDKDIDALTVALKCYAKDACDRLSTSDYGNASRCSCELNRLFEQRPNPAWPEIKKALLAYSRCVRGYDYSVDREPIEPGTHR